MEIFKKFENSIHFGSENYTSFYLSILKFIIDDMV